MGHPLSTYAKFSDKLTFLTPWYTHAHVRIRGLEMLVFRKILRTYLMDDPQAYVFERVLNTPRQLYLFYALLLEKRQDKPYQTNICSNIFQWKHFAWNISLIPYNSLKNKPIWKYIHLRKTSLN